MNHDLGMQIMNESDLYHKSMSRKHEKQSAKELHKGAQTYKESKGRQAFSMIQKTKDVLFKMFQKFYKSSTFFPLMYCKTPGSVSCKHYYRFRKRETGFLKETHKSELHACFL